MQCSQVLGLFQTLNLRKRRDWVPKDNRFHYRRGTLIITDTHKAKAPEKKAAHEYRDEHTPDVTSIVTNGLAVKSAYGLPTTW